MTQETNDTSATDQATDEMLQGRYRLIRELGRGSQGKLFEAEDTDTGREVAVKELDLKLVDEWKAIELFEREAKVLASLDHPGIPSYIDAFHEDRPDGSQRFFLVQQYVDGTSLSEMVDDGLRMDEAAARDFIDEMLTILGYMQSLNPPVIHRDIKPSNIIVCPDGSYMLVDFGAVQTILPETVGGSTVVGTSGFMPPEQLMGRATLGSDIYGLGATVVNAMTGVDPVDFEMVRMKMQFHQAIEASPELLDLLDGMLDPSLENRLPDARAVLAEMATPSGANKRGEDIGAAPETSTALISWDSTAQKIAQLKNNPPRIPLSMIDADPERLTIDVGPISPPLRNCSMPFILMTLAIIIGLFGAGCLLVVTVPLAIFLIYKAMGYLRPVSERLEITPEILTIQKTEHKRIGPPKMTTQTFDIDSLYLPHVHRVQVEGFHSGQQFGGDPNQGDGSMMDGIGDFKPGKPGLIFTTSDGERTAFGATILNQHRFIQIGQHDDQGELDWLDTIVTEYMKFVRQGGPDE